jgi:hypothetical protein
MSLSYILRCLCVSNALLRETREGWPLPTAETEVNGDTKSTNKRSSVGLSWHYTIFLFCLGCSSRPSTKYFFLIDTISIPLSPTPSKLKVKQAALLSLLSLIMYLSLALLSESYGCEISHRLSREVVTANTG